MTSGFIRLYLWSSGSATQTSAGASRTLSDLIDASVSYKQITAGCYCSTSVVNWTRHSRSTESVCLPYYRCAAALKNIWTSVMDYKDSASELFTQNIRQKEVCLAWNTSSVEKAGEKKIAVVKCWNVFVVKRTESELNWNKWNESNSEMNFKQLQGLWGEPYKT